jgi:hypothetical protein
MTTPDRPADVTARVLLRRMIREWLDMDTNDPFDEEMAATPSGQELLRRADATRAAEGANQPLIAAQVAPTRKQMVGALVRDGWSSTIAEASIATRATDAEVAGLFSKVDNDPDEWHHIGSCPYCTGDHDAAEARSMNGNKVLRLLALAAQPAAPEAEPERFTGQDSWMCVCGHPKSDHYFGDKPAPDGGYGAWCQLNAIDHWTEFRCMAFTPAPR